MTGSIPACAGEPLMTPIGSRFCHDRVYPRVCGGTNPLTVRKLQRGGSIPACAGEPNFGYGGAASSRVYPRVCGRLRRPKAHAPGDLRDTAEPGAPGVACCLVACVGMLISHGCTPIRAAAHHR